MTFPTDPDELAGAGEPNVATRARLETVVAATYRITRYIGSGSSGHVYEAEHLRLGLAVALKLLRPELGMTLRTAQRFRREARAIASLKSEHVVRVIDCGELEDGTPFLVMELLQGEDLRALLVRQGALSSLEACRIARDACTALVEVHEAGLVHRDLKPENLFIARHSNAQDTCKVLDFGVAKMSSSFATAQGALVGTVRYMAPEQLTDGASVGAAADIYAIGAILYECLCGRPPHEGATTQELMYKIINQRPAALEVRCPGLAPALVAVVESCLDKEPRQRPGSARELASQLSAASFDVDAASQGRTLPEADGSVPPATQSRKAVRSWTSRVGLVAALGGAAACGWLARSAQRSALPAEPAVPVAAAAFVPAPVERTAAAPLPAAAAAASSTAESKPSSRSPAASAAAAPPVEASLNPPSKKSPARNAASKPVPSASARSPLPSVAVSAFDAANPYPE